MMQTKEVEEQVTLHPTLVVIFATNPRLLTCFSEAERHPTIRRLLNNQAAVNLVSALRIVGGDIWDERQGPVRNVPDAELEHFWLLVRSAGNRYRVKSGEGYLWPFAATAYRATSGQDIPRRGSWSMRRDPPELRLLYHAFARAFANLPVPKPRPIAKRR